MDTRALRAALGPKPGSAELRQAVRVEEDDPFFVPIDSLQAPQYCRQESVGDFVAKQRTQQGRRVPWENGVRLIPIGNQDDASMLRFKRVADWLSAFLYPVLVKVEPIPQLLDKARLKLFKLAQDNQTIDLTKVKEAVTRESNTCSLVVSFTRCSKNLTEHDQNVAVLVANNLSERQTYAALCRQILFQWADMAPCTYFVCLLNPDHCKRAQAPMSLCPVCLMKLAVAVGISRFKPSERYRRLVESFQGQHINDFKEEINWMAARLAHLGDPSVLQILDEQQVPEEQKEINTPSQPQVEDAFRGTVLPYPASNDETIPYRGSQSATRDHQRMKAELGLLKGRLKQKALQTSSKILGARSIC